MIISRQRGHIKGVKVQVRVLLEPQRILFLELIEGYPSEDGHCRDGRVHFFLKNNYYFVKKLLKDLEVSFFCRIFAVGK